MDADSNPLDLIRAIRVIRGVLCIRFVNDYQRQGCRCYTIGRRV